MSDSADNAIPLADDAGPPTAPLALMSPYIGAGLPSGYVASWGDYYLALSAGTAGNLRDSQPDGSVNMGLGFGDAQKAVGVGVDWGIGSVKNFGANGGLSVNVGRIITNQPSLVMAVAAGWTGFYRYGPELESRVAPSNVYGVFTATKPLRANDPVFRQNLQFSVGVGGSDLAPMNNNFETPSTGYFAALGVELTNNLGVSVGWSGRGSNVNLSYIPFRTVPISLSLTAADVFNSSPFGTVGVLSVVWGDNLRSILGP